MTEIFDFAAYMNKSIENIIGKTLKSATKNPREAAFIMKFALSQKNAQKVRLQHEDAGRHIPPFLIASITKRCNLFCKGCYARANNSFYGNLEELSLLRWHEIFQEATELGISFILLAGGEPLMRSEIIKEAAKFKKIVFPVFTNGTMFNEEILELFDQNRNLFPILSIEGDSVLTDLRRGEGTYQALEKVFKELKDKGIFFGVSITVTRENISLVSDSQFVDYLNYNNCKLVLYVEYVPVLKESDTLAPGEKERQFLKQRQRKLEKEYEDILFLAFPGDEDEAGGCLAAGRGFFHINPYGGAEPCPFSPYSDIDLKEKSIMQCLDSNLFKELKTSGILMQEHTGGCTLFTYKDQVEKIIIDNM